MKNLYALDNKNYLIHIKNVDKKLKEKYICVNCNGELIAKKGKVKAHHFSHKSEGNCSFESYLHKLAKLKFYEKYRKSIENNNPFYIDYTKEFTCNSCIKIKNIRTQCKLENKIQKFDLTKRFDLIELEKGTNGFIADVLLKSSSKNEELLIEFAVTHKCEKEKIDSGLRIIEIQLQNENQLEFIDNNHIKFSDEKISYFNFSPKHVVANIKNPYNCQEKFEFFFILKNNKANKRDKKMSEIISEINSLNLKYFKVLEKRENEYDGLDYIELITDYAYKDKTFKNCYSCRFITNNTSRYSYYDLFCKRLKAEVPNSNIGCDCDKYWRIE